MKLIDAKVNWMLDLDNSPRLMITVDKIPELRDLRFEERGGLYFAEKGGFVQHFAWRGPGNERGYGGATCDIIMTDGSHRKLLGPWSSGSHVMNAAGWGPCMEVTIIEGRYPYGGTIMLWLAEAANELFNLGLEFYPEKIDGLTYYVPTLFGMTPEESKAIIQSRKEVC